MDTTGRTHIPFLALAAVAIIAQALITFGRSPTATVRPIHDASPAQAKLVGWALGRFERAGLDLPGFDIHFHSDIRDCRGHVGLYWSDRQRLDVCTYHFDLMAKLTMLHEMAHAWDDLELTDHARERFMQLRGVETWSSWNEPWELRGTEHAAEVITWGLMDERIHSVHIPDNDPGQLLEAFRLLTGRAPMSPGAHPAEDRATEALSLEAGGGAAQAEGTPEAFSPEPFKPYEWWADRP